MQEIFRETLRFVHGSFGLLVIAGMLFTLRRLESSKTPRSSIPFLCYSASALVLIVHSLMKSCTDLCISSTETGAECGQMLYSVSFDLLIVSLSKAIFLHPSVRHSRYHGRVDSAVAFFLGGYVLAMSVLTAEWVRAKDPDTYALLRGARMVMIVLISLGGSAFF